MDASCSCRRADADDIGFLTEMLAEAVAWQPDAVPSVAAVLADPHLAHYVDGFPRDGDVGIIATAGSLRVGAAWCRYFTDEDHGFGFVDSSTPELAIGVVPGRRGAGVGRALLRALMRAAAEGGCERISLSVEPANPALRLYESLDFRRVGEVGGAWTMFATADPG